MHDSVYATLIWKERLNQKQKKNPVECCSLAVSPDGSRLVCGVGERILVFDSMTGDLLHSLKGHKDDVYCVAWSTNGKIVASGGADNTVVLWSSKFEGIVKYSHNESVQCLAFNPQTHELISGATTDFGVWKENQKVVSKNSVSSKILTLAWTTDGNYLASGHFDGSVSIRDQAFHEKVVVQRAAPVCSLAWSHQKDSGYVLNVGSWSGSISTHSLSGETISETFLEAVPAALVFDASTGCILVGGTDKKVQLLTNDGKIQADLLETEEWVWSIQSFYYQNNTYFAAITTKGTLLVNELKIETLFDISGQWYIQRQQVNTITIRNLDSKKFSQVSYKSLVESVAIYKSTIAVQLSSEVCLCSVTKELSCKIINKLQIPKSWKLRMISSCHVHCLENRQLYSLDFDGRKHACWSFSSEITCGKVVGGPSQHETMLIGCSRGEIYRVFLHNSSPQLLAECSHLIKLLDMSLDFKKVAVVDSQGVLSVFDALTHEKLFEDNQTRVHGLAMNQNFSDMFVYTSENTLNIKTGDFAVYKQTLAGTVIGFRSSTVYLLQDKDTVSVDVLQSLNLKRYIANGDFQNAFNIASLKATQDEWTQLGLESLKNNQMSIARKCFIRLQDMKFLDLIDRLVQDKDLGNSIVPEILCLQGRFNEAAEYHARKDDMERALAVFSDLKLFNEGYEWLQQHSQRVTSTSEITTAAQWLLSDQIKWSEQTKDIKEAFELCLKTEKFAAALDIIESQVWPQSICRVTALLAEQDKHLLKRCAVLSAKHGRLEEAEKTLRRLPNQSALVKFYCSTGQWSKLHSWIEPTSVYWKEVQMAYAEWLLKENNFEGAVEAFISCKATDRVIPLLHQQLQTLISIEEFSEVSRFYMKLAQLALSISKDSIQFQKYMKLSETYYIYSMINSSVHSPFTTTHLTTLFNAAQFLSTQLHNLQEASPPKGIKMSYVLYVLFKCARALGAHLLAKKCCERLLTLQLPFDWKEEVLLELLRLQAEDSLADVSDMLPTCPRCGETNGNLSLEDDSCSYCRTPFVRCFVTFDRLPVIEFFLKEGITLPDALLSIDADPLEDGPSHEKQDSGPEVWRLDDSDGEDSFDDPFSSLTAHLGSTPVLDLSSLRKIPRREILVLRITTQEPHEASDESSTKSVRFFKVMDDSFVFFVGDCGHLYLHDEYRQVCLETGQKPFSM